MVYRIFIGNKKIELPNNLNVEERCALCDKIISENYEYFDYDIPSVKVCSGSTSEKIKTRLDIMGQYIYKASVYGNDDSVITNSKKSRNKIREVVFSDIENDKYNF